MVFPNGCINLHSLQHWGVQGLSFLYARFVLLTIALLPGVRSQLTVILPCISLIIRDVESFCLYLLAICMYSPEKCLFGPFAHFLGLLLFTLLKYFNIKPLSSVRLAGIFFQLTDYNSR